MTAAAATRQCLTFSLADEQYAVGLTSVREIIEYDTITRVPSTPAWIRGVINMRGSVVPVVDLAVKLGLPERPTTRRTCVVIVEVDLAGDRAVMGVLADTVDEVQEIAESDIEPPPPFGTRMRMDFLLGLARAGRKFLLLLDIDRVLSTSELLAAANAAQEPLGGESPA